MKGRTEIMLEGLQKKSDKLDKQNEYLQYLLLNFKVEKRQGDKEEALKTIKEMRTTLTEISTDLKDFYIRK